MTVWHHVLPRRTSVSGFGCVALSVLIFSSSLKGRAQQGEAGRGSASAVEQFKAFLATPPVIENLVFEQELPVPFKSAPTNAAQADPRHRPTYRRYFQARWQPGDVLFRQIQGPQGATNPLAGGPLVLVSGSRYWVADNKRFITEWTDNGVAFERTNNPVADVVTNRLIPFWEQMLFGVEHLELGQIAWHGNRFRAESLFDPFNVSGEVLARADGLPYLMRFKDTYHATGLSSDWIIRYEYQKGLPFIPKRTTSYWLDGGEEVRMQQFTVLELKIGCLYT